MYPEMDSPQIQRMNFRSSKLSLRSLVRLSGASLMVVEILVLVLLQPDRMFLWRIFHPTSSLVPS